MNCLTIIVATVILAFGCLQAANGRKSRDDTLVLVHTLFRHGNRTPDGNGYPSNPISNDSFYWPYGYSQLTDIGKRTEYNIGLTLRTRYDRFLGNVYNINLLDARSTNVNRTKMSLELMLAGLWPPSPSQTWWPGLNWQPIPYNYLTNDKELQGTQICTNYKVLNNEVLESNEFQEALDQYNDIFEYISNNTGKSYTTPENIFGLYFNLLTQKEFGYPLEAWTKPVFPEILENLTKMVYYIGTKTATLKRIAGGFLLRKIINDSKAKIDGLLTPQSRKMFIYSAHERNVANFLITLGVFDDNIPSYGSHVLLELHNIKGEYGFQVYYQDWSTPTPKLLVIPGCQVFCKFDDFVFLLKDVIATDDDCVISS